MRLRSGFAALALATGCFVTPTALLDRAPGPPPSGLPVALTIAPVTPTSALPPAITAAGDSVAVWAEYTVGCFDYAATAGVSTDNTLVVTITESTSPTIGYCALDLEKAFFRAVVRPAPRGTYPVVLRQRMDWVTDGPVEQVRARGSASLP